MQEISAELREKITEIAGGEAVTFPDGAKGKAVFHPSSRDDLSRFAALCSRHRVPMRPCSGESGMRSGIFNVLFDRMDKVLAVDPVEGTITVQAGCTFENARRVADEAGFLFPLYMNAPETARIGGGLAANVVNAGVFRYGTPKELTLGTELVLSDGTVKNTLEKYATSEADTMKNLFVGSRGSIGFITAAVIKLHPKPVDMRRMLCLCDGLSGVGKLFELSRHLGATLLTGFDVFPRSGMNEILADVRDLKKPADAAWYVLIEFSSTVVNEGVGAFLEELKREAVRKGLIREAVTSKHQENAENLARIGVGLRCLNRPDGAAFFKEAVLPVSKMAGMLERLEIQAAYAFPKAVLIPLSRLGEGSLFLRVRFPEDVNGDAAEKQAAGVFGLFENLARQAGGMCAGQTPDESQSGESEKGEFADMIRALKSSFDPYNLMNPV